MYFGQIDMSPSAFHRDIGVVIDATVGVKYPKLG